MMSADDLSRQQKDIERLSGWGACAASDRPPVRPGPASTNREWRETAHHHAAGPWCASSPSVVVTTSCPQYLRSLPGARAKHRHRPRSGSASAPSKARRSVTERNLPAGYHPPASRGAGNFIVERIRRVADGGAARLLDARVDAERQTAVAGMRGRYFAIWVSVFQSLSPVSGSGWSPRSGDRSEDPHHGAPIRPAGRASHPRRKVRSRRSRG